MTEELHDYLNKDRPLYKQLKKDKENGKILTKKDLTKDILYTLAIEENVVDSWIGDLFDLSKTQVVYLREKYHLQNKFMKRMIDQPKQFLEYLENKGFDTSIYSSDEWMNIFYSSFRIYSQEKNWNMDTFEEYLKEKLNKNIEANDELSDTELEYEVIYVDNKHIGNKIHKGKKSNGQRINQSESNKNKIDSGKLGERIIYRNEIKKLKNLGLTELANDVIWVSKPDDNNITLDGLGYDIISYNELGEKIYIEVKCSTTNNTDNIIFDISQKEVDFMNGKLDGIDKNHCFIYYVFNINKKLLQAQVFKINHDIFSTYKLVPTHYKVHELYINE